MKCVNCHEEILEDNPDMCPYCGSKNLIPLESPYPTVKSQSTITTQTKVLKPKSKYWNLYWVVLVSVSIVIAVFGSYFSKFSQVSTANVLIVTLLGIGFAYYITVKPSTAANRSLFLFVGATVLGFILWGALMIFSNAGIRWAMSNEEFDLFALTSLIACWIIGALIGDLVGKKRNYQFPHLEIF